MKLNPTATATVYEGFKSLFPGADHLACGLAVATDESFYISGSVVGPGIDGGEMHYVLSGGSWSTGFHNTLIAGGYTDVVLQPDGKPVIIAPGDGTSPGFRFRRRLAGSLDLDPSFSGGQVEYPFTDGPGADVSLGRSLALQNGRILAVGEAEWNDPDFDFGILRLESSPIFFDGFETGGLSAWSTVAP